MSRLPVCLPLVLAAGWCFIGYTAWWLWRWPRRSTVRGLF